MIVGMKKFVVLYPHGIRIQSLDEYKEYCYYVAGTVGYLVTDLWHEHTPSIGARRHGVLREKCRAFAEALQTVNIDPTSINKVVLFWAGFVLIQPFGATAGDLWTKKAAIGGMGFPTYYASAILAAVLILFVVMSGSATVQSDVEGGVMALDAA